jgi:hypothetical protein
MNTESCAWFLCIPLDSTRIFLGHVTYILCPVCFILQDFPKPAAATIRKPRWVRCGEKPWEVNLGGYSSHMGRSSSTMVMVTLLYGLSGNHWNSMVYGRYNMI